MVERVSEADLLEALRSTLAAPTAGDGGMSTEDIMAHFGCSHKAARAMLRTLFLAGKLQCVHVARPAMDGAMRRVPTYVLKP